MKPRLVSARELLGGALDRAGYRAQEFPIFEFWDRMLGKEAASARPAGLKKGKLYVDVDSNIRMHRLVLEKRSLLAKINGAFGGRIPGEGPIFDIIFRLGETSPPDEKNGRPSKKIRP